MADRHQPATARLPELQRAAGRGVLPAEWALARLHLSRGQSAAALPRLQRYLSATPPAVEDDDPGRAAAYPARHAKRAPVEAFLAWVHAEAARAQHKQG